MPRSAYRHAYTVRNAAQPPTRLRFVYLPAAALDGRARTYLTRLPTHTQGCRADQTPTLPAVTKTAQRYDTSTFVPRMTPNTASRRVWTVGTPNWPTFAPALAGRLETSRAHCNTRRTDSCGQNVGCSPGYASRMTFCRHHVACPETWFSSTALRTHLPTFVNFPDMPLPPARSRFFSPPFPAPFLF